MQKKIRKSNIFEAVIMVVLFLLVAFVFGVNMFFYKDSAAPSFLGRYYVYIKSDANIKDIEENDVVICDSAMLDNLQVENVVLVNVNDEKDKAILRIVDMDESTYTLKSDFSTEDDTIVLPKSNVIALCHWTVDNIGEGIDFATSNAGIVLLIVLPCTIIVLLQAMRVLDKDGKVKENDVQKNEAYEKDRKAREKKEKEEAKRRKLRNNNEDEEESDIYLIKKNKNGNPAIIPADEEDSEPEIIKTINEEEYAEVQKNVEAKIAAAEKIYDIKSESDEVNEISETPEPVKNIKDIDLSAFNKPQIEHKIIEPKTMDNDDIISEIVEETPVVEKISAPVSVKTETKPEPVRKIIKAEPESKKPVSAPAPAPVKKKTSSSANKYTSNKYTSNAMRRSSSSKTSVDDLIKTIDSEKSKFHK